MIDVFLVKYSFYSIKHNIFHPQNFDKLKNAIKIFQIFFYKYKPYFAYRKKLSNLPFFYQSLTLNKLPTFFRKFFSFLNFFIK